MMQGRLMTLQSSEQQNTSSEYVTLIPTPSDLEGLLNYVCMPVFTQSSRSHVCYSRCLSLSLGCDVLGRNGTF